MKNLSGSTLLVMIICAALTVAVWSMLSKPYTAPDWPESITGFAFSPYQKNQDGNGDIQPDLEEIDADLELLSGLTQAVRTYSTEGVFFEIPHLAANHGLNVTVGAWLDTRLDNNSQEIAGAIALAQQVNVTHVLIGNEVLLRNDLSLQALITYLDQARDAIEKPVSTAETWKTWVDYPQLAEHVDFIAVHILPYWEEIDVTQAVAFTAERVAQLKELFPDKPLVIAEVGWPSEGRTRNAAVSSPANQAWFLRQFLDLAGIEGYEYFLMEAFDQPWKRKNEGAVGAYWGIYDVERQAKFAFNGPIINIPAWQLFALISITVGILILSLYYLVSNTITNRGKILLAGIVFGLTTLVAWLIADYATMYMTLAGIITGIVLLFLMLAMVLLILSEAHEWIEAHWVSHRRRQLRLDNKTQKPQAMVSIHVPTFNEPPEMMIQTLNALANLEYENYEVIIIDNNTKDTKVWQPVALHCEKLGEKFHFHHVDPLSGFKAGALNYALHRTSKAAAIVAVIDSDYVVDSNWLRDLAPAFDEPKVAIVQAPQDYRDEEDNAFKAMCNAEYQGFFQIGMVTRNERNAIIQHGTMTLIRRETLDQVGGWAEWCITEDAELGLRIFEAGYEASYTSQSYGRGLTPDTFIDYKKQRYRWAYGAMQILKKHFLELFISNASHLSMGQRYHFIAGWLPWLAQSANLIFSVLAIMWCAGMIYAPESFEAPHLAFSVFPILFFSFNLIKLFHLYLFRLKVTLIKAIAAGISGLSLSHTIGKAMLVGLFTSDQPFVRTPKKTAARVLSAATASAFEESALFLAFMFAIYTLAKLPHIESPDFSLWIILLIIQSIPYAAALITSLISACRLPSPIVDINKLIKTSFGKESNE